jgi:hypothetical protein
VLKGAIRNLSKTAKEMRVKINLQKKKTKYMEVTKRASHPRMFKVDDQQYESK